MIYPVGWLLKKKVQNTISVGKKVEKFEPSCNAGGNVK